MNRFTMAIIAVIAVLAVVVGVVAYSMTWGGSPLGGIRLVSYKALSGEKSPILVLQFSENLDMHSAVELVNSTGSIVGVWKPNTTHPGSIIKIDNIVPPNLIGSYVVKVLWDGKETYKRRISFSTPVLSAVSIHVEKYVKGDTAYLEYVELTIEESGDSPYYFNRVSWEIEDYSNSEKVPMQHFTPNYTHEVKVNIAKYMSTGPHRLVVHFDCFDFTSIEIAVTVNL